jgi:hypothetical protein
MNWIKESIKKSKTLKDHYKLHDIDVFIKDKFTTDLDFDFCLRQVASKIPSYLLSGIDIIYVGQFDFLNKREISAIYDKGAIYVTNVQEDEQDIIEDIIHEISHSLEERYSDFIYSDGKMMNEFLGKRKKLYFLLKAENQNPPVELQTKIEFDQNIDDYLYKQVGYKLLWSLVTGLFISPYSVTDLREYFAVGFEYYVQGDFTTVKQMCPTLFTRLEELFDLEG